MVEGGDVRRALFVTAGENEEGREKSVACAREGRWWWLAGKTIRGASAGDQVERSGGERKQEGRCWQKESDA